MKIYTVTVIIIMITVFSNVACEEHFNNELNYHFKKEHSKIQFRFQHTMLAANIMEQRETDATSAGSRKLETSTAHA